MKHYLLQYDLASNYLDGRPQFRDEHLALAWHAHERGEFVLAGALAEPVDGAVLLFLGESPAVAEAFARADPYVRNGLVTSWRGRPWTTVVGAEAATPVRPNPRESRISRATTFSIRIALSPSGGPRMHMLPRRSYCRRSHWRPEGRGSGGLHHLQPI